MISVTQAAELIGITRAAVYKAIEKHTLRALHIGNVPVVERASALPYRAARREAPPPPYVQTQR
jgi:excisionase family DNA binding protein